MSILVHSRDIYLSTQQSGAAGTGDRSFGRFRMCLNSAPLVCNNGEMLKLSLTQFSCFRNFYYINEHNCRVDISWTDNGGVRRGGYLLLDQQDYGGIGDIAANFTQKLINFFKAGGSNTNTFTTWTAITTLTAPTTQPAVGFNIGDTGDRIFQTTLNGFPTSVNNLIIQTRQYTGDDVVANDKVYTSFGDSYVILGSKRIGSPSETANSFDVTAGDVPNRTIKGFYPMQRTSMEFMYLRCVGLGSDNLQSQNLLEPSSAPDSHMIHSQVISKIPVSNETCSWQSQSSNCPYFVNSKNQMISEIVFELVDHHGRPIPQVAASIESDGNLFSNLTMKVDTFAIGGNEHTLNTPVKNDSDGLNRINYIQGIIGWLILS